MKLERLCRFVSRPPMAEERLALMSSGALVVQELYDDLPVG